MKETTMFRITKSNEDEWVFSSPKYALNTRNSSTILADFVCEIANAMSHWSDKDEITLIITKENKFD